MGEIFLEPNSSIEHNVFLDLTKTALLVPLNEGKFQIFDHFKHVFKNLWKCYTKTVTSCDGKCFFATIFYVSKKECLNS